MRERYGVNGRPATEVCCTVHGGNANREPFLSEWQARAGWRIVGSLGRPGPCNSRGSGIEAPAGRGKFVMS